MCEYWLHSCGHTTKTPCPRPKQTTNVQGQQSRNPSIVQGSRSRNASDTPSRNGSTARSGSNASAILTPSTPSDSSTITFTNPFASGLANALAACKDRIANNPANSCKGMPDQPRQSADPCYPCVLEDAQRKTLEEGPEVEQKLAQAKRDGFYQRGRGGWTDDAYGVDGLGGQSGGYSGGGFRGDGGHGSFPVVGGGFRGRGAGRGGYADRGFGRDGPGGFRDQGSFAPGTGPRGGFAPGGPAGFGHGGFAPAGGHGLAYGQDANGYNDFGGGGWGRGGDLGHPGGPAHVAFHGNSNGFNGGFTPQQQNFGSAPGQGGFQGGGFFPPNGMATPGMVPATPAMMPNGMVDHGMFAPGPQNYGPGPGPQGFAPGPNAGFAPNGFGGNPYGGYF